jgi:hypothetical protein
MIHLLPLSSCALNPPKFSGSRENFRSASSFGQSPKNSTSKLPKINFSKFEGEPPKLWQSICESYFDMYEVDSSFWVKVATMHFKDPTTRWLQYIDHQVHKATWTELCSWIHDRFNRDQYELLIRQLYKFKQVGSMQDYIDKFCELIDQLQAYNRNTDLYIILLILLMIFMRISSISLLLKKT